MNIRFSEDAVKEAFRASVQRVLSAEKELAAGALAELETLLAELMPLVIQQTHALIAGDPAVASGYLKVLEGTVHATIARLNLRAIAGQRRLIASLLAGGVQLLVIALKAAVLVP